MNRNKFSPKIYEYATVAQAEEIFKVSRHTLMRLANAYGCVVSIGSRNKRINVRKLAECLEQQEVIK